MSIKKMAEDDRPREKFLTKGQWSLSDSELLAIIMGSGNRTESAVELARRILSSVGNNWHQLSLLSIKDLMKFKGVGEAKAISIATALEIGKRKSLQEIPESPIIRESIDCFRLLHPRLSDIRKEEFWIILLNNNNKVIHQTKCFEGGITASIVDIRIICKIALEHYATAIIIAHNHPSGNLSPSEEDKEITKRIKAATEILNISLLDHLIITSSHYFSFADNGLL